MTNSLRTQAASLSLAALVTLAMLIGVNALAASERVSAEHLAHAAATQPA